MTELNWEGFAAAWKAAFKTPCTQLLHEGAVRAAIKAYLPFHDKEQDDLLKNMALDNIADNMKSVRLEEENKALREAMKLLLEAKHIKDKFGKGPAYEQLKERGWKAAEELMKE